MDNFELIEKFLSKQMSKEEEADFLKSLDENPALKKDLNLQQDLNSFLDVKHERDSIKIQVQDILNERKRRKSVTLKKYYTAAAVIIVLISLSVTTFIFMPAKNERLFNNYYETYQFSATERSEKERTTNITEKVYEAYTNHEFDAFISIYNTNDLISRKNFMLDFLYSLSLIETNKTENALPILEELSNSNYMYSETAEWYLALAYLKSNHKTKATQLLLEIAKKNNYYTPKAKELNKKLK